MKKKLIELPIVADDVLRNSSVVVASPSGDFRANISALKAIFEDNTCENAIPITADELVGNETICLTQNGIKRQISLYELQKFILRVASHQNPEIIFDLRIDNLGAMDNISI